MKNAILHSLRYFPRVLLMAGLLAGCDAGKDPVAPPPRVATADALPASTWFPLHVDNIVLEAQFALKPTEMQHGLMGRTDLHMDQGMLFVYDAPQGMSFWMRNTPTPLDIGFFDAQGVLREVYQMYPYDETSISSTHRDLQFALEMKQGWFSAQGLKPGARLDLSQITSAMRARGVDPVLYGLP